MCLCTAVCVKGKYYVSRSGSALAKCLKFKKINASRVNPVQQEFAFRNSARSD